MQEKPSRPTKFTSFNHKGEHNSNIKVLDKYFKIK